jgi:hypothetical protein
VRFTPDFERRRQRAGRRNLCRENFHKSLGLVLVHPDPRYGPNPTRTLQIKEVAGKNLPFIHDLLSKVLLDVDPRDLKLRRVDLTSDLIDGPTIEQFRKTTRVRLKRKFTEYVNPNGATGDFVTQCRESGAVETIYYGCIDSGDCLKIYDKSRELKTCPASTISSHRIASPGNVTEVVTVAVSVDSEGADLYSSKNEPREGAKLRL